MSFRIFLTNLGAYNRGELIGDWIDLPMDEDELQIKLQEILNAGGEENNDEESFITDFENDYDYKVGEYENLMELNELAQDLEDLVNNLDENIVKAAIQNFCDIHEAIEALEKGDFSYACDIDDEEDLGNYVVDEGLFGIDIPDQLKNYIDYEAIGRDMTCDGWTIYPELNIAVCWY
jgi:antirestriction protein